MIEAVSKMALDFNQRGDISMVGLLKESGYADNPSKITQEDLTEQFRKHPELIETWVIQSDDKRTSSGWFIKEPENSLTRNKAWVVGFYPIGDTNEFLYAAEACGFYVKMEAEQIRHDT
jgi:hypothetical protein